MTPSDKALVAKIGHTVKQIAERDCWPDWIWSSRWALTPTELEMAASRIEALSADPERVTGEKEQAERYATIVASEINELRATLLAAEAEVKRLHSELTGERNNYVTMDAELRGEIARLRDALTPSAETKAAYMGEFRFQFDEFTPNVPWTTIKEIMAAILRQALEAKTDG